jgi:hypothetical protein
MSNPEIAKISYILVCDDLREEKESNKFTLLGLYSGKLRLDAIPAMLPKIAFRICIRDVKIGSTMNMDLYRPDGSIVGGGKIKIEAMDNGRGEAFVNLIFAPFPIDAPGPYKFVLTQGDKKSSAVAFEAELKMPKKT